jgi:iron-sulfur cluster assembly accessory protein
MVVKLTDKAIQHFTNIAAGKNVKFGIIGGGCAGFQYHWEIIDGVADHMLEDEVITYPEFNLYVDSHSIMYLVGTTVDYVSDITGSKIELFNPNAQSGCGCGVSVNFA